MGLNKKPVESAKNKKQREQREKAEAKAKASSAHTAAADKSSDSGRTSDEEYVPRNKRGKGNNNKKSSQHPSKPAPPVPKITPKIQAWEPQAHTCARCDTKTTDKAFVRCLWEKDHAEVCKKWHHTVFQIGTSSQCQACLNEGESKLKRGLDIKKKQQEIEVKKVDYGEKSAVVRRLRKELETLKMEDGSVDAATAKNQSNRMEAFFASRWAPPGGHPEWVRYAVLTAKTKLN